MHLFLRPAALVAVLLALVVLAGCSAQSSDVLGKAYIAPASLNLRRELAQKNNTVAVLKHGDRVDIIDVRRRFVKIRTARAAEGWVDSSDLLSPEQMKQIQLERQQALALPSQGAATVYEALNIHLEPDRRSPAFARIPEGGAVSVLAHRLTPKNSAALGSPSLVIERPQPPTHKSHKDKPSQTSLRLPPKPPPPKPPANWEDLSTERVDGAQSSAETQAQRDKQVAGRKAAELNKPAVMEDWTLVRTKDNQSGWVLSRNLMTSIPDEVAQYAEGKRITSYFDLGSVSDEQKGEKHNWLWTTSSEPEPYDFDAWRVFLWNRRHHRYETSYRLRDLEGYFPVHVDEADSNAFGRAFEIITKDDDGKFRRRTYLFDGVRVHLTASQEYQPAAAAAGNKPATLDTSKLQQKTPRSGWLTREWNQLKRRVEGQ